MISGPIPHYVLSNQLNDIKFPEQKIKYLKSKGKIKSLVRGWYLYKENKYSGFQIANVLYGPSYVTGITVLSWLGWIEERVVTIHSATVKRGRTIDTPIGRFNYFHQSSEIFAFGIQHYDFGPGMGCVIATPTKALFDHFFMTPHLHFTGKSDLLKYLEDELRLDIELLQNIDLKLLKKLIERGKKKRQTNILYNLAKEFQ